MLHNLYSWFAYMFDTVEKRRSEEHRSSMICWSSINNWAVVVEILVELFCGENELDDCNREINRLTPKLSAHSFVNAFTAL